MVQRVYHGRQTGIRAAVAETSLKRWNWTVFTRGEVTENRELEEALHHGPAHRVGKLSVGAVRDFRIAPHLKIGAGALASVNFVPDALKADYGGSNPVGGMAFVRLKID